AGGLSALARGWACARSIETRNGAVGGPNEAVKYIARVNDFSRCRSRGVEAINATRPTALPRACAPTRRIEARDGAVGRAYEAVTTTGRDDGSTAPHAE